VAIVDQHAGNGRGWLLLLLAGSSQVITSNDTVPWGEVLRWSHDSRTYQKKWCEPLPAPITRGSRVQASGLCVGATLCRGGRWSLLPMATETSIRTKNNLTFQHKTTTIQHATATATPLESYVALIVLLTLQNATLIFSQAHQTLPSRYAPAQTITSARHEGQVMPPGYGCTPSTTRCCTCGGQISCRWCTSTPCRPRRRGRRHTCRCIG